MHWCRVLVFKEAPKLVFTGLTKAIGQPREYEKNLENPAIFDQTIDLSIPVETTNEFPKPKSNIPAAIAGSARASTEPSTEVP